MRLCLDCRQTGSYHAVIPLQKRPRSRAPKAGPCPKSREAAQILLVLPKQSEFLVKAGRLNNARPALVYHEGKSLASQLLFHEDPGPRCPLRNQYSTPAGSGSPVRHSSCSQPWSQPRRSSSKAHPAAPTCTSISPPGLKPSAACSSPSPIPTGRPIQTSAQASRDSSSTPRSPGWQARSWDCSCPGDSSP